MFPIIKKPYQFVHPILSGFPSRVGANRQPGKTGFSIDDIKSNILNFILLS